MSEKATQLQYMRLLADALGVPVTNWDCKRLQKLLTAVRNIFQVQSRPRTKDAYLKKLCAHLDVIQANRQTLRTEIGFSERPDADDIVYPAVVDENFIDADEDPVDQNHNDIVYAAVDDENFNIEDLDF